MTTPTVGRKVWYRPEGPDGKTLDATVCAVHENGSVNIAVNDEYGEVLGGFRSVPLRQDGESAPATPYCEWMPYQIAAAKDQASAAAQTPAAAPAPAAETAPAAPTAGATGASEPQQ